MELSTGLPLSSWAEQDFLISPDPSAVGLDLHSVFLNSAGRRLARFATPRDYRGVVCYQEWRYVTHESTSAFGFATFLGNSAQAATIEFHPTYLRTIRFSGFALNPSP